MTQSIRVYLTTSSPMYVAYPDNQIKNKDGKVNQTVTMPLFVDGKPIRLPYYAGNSLRGGLRRHAAERVMRGLSRRGERVLTDLYLGLCSGAASGKPENDSYVEEILRVRENVYMGLFGGGIRLHQSMFKPSNMMPVTNETLRAGLVPQYLSEKAVDVAPENYFRDLYTLITQTRVDDLLHGKNPELINIAIEDAINAVAAHNAGVLENKKAREEAKESGETVKKTDTSNMQTYRAVAAGMPFYFDVLINEAATDAQVGFLLQCLSDLFAANAFGGMSRAGFGRVRVQEVRVSSNFGGEQVFEGNFYTPENIFNPHAFDAAQHLFSAADAAVAILTREELEGFFTPKKAEEPKKAKGKKKAGAEVETAESASE